MRKVVITVHGNLKVHKGSEEHVLTCPYGRFCNVMCAKLKKEEISNGDTNHGTVEIFKCSSDIIGEHVTSL